MRLLTKPLLLAIALCASTATAPRSLSQTPIAPPSAPAAAPSTPRNYPDPQRFEKSILAFESRDQQSPPPRGGIVCVGSSSMVGWHPTIASDLAPLPVIARGFGGSNMNDALHYLDRAVLRYQPRAIVLYEGDNDIGQGIAPEKIRDTFLALVKKVHQSLPAARIYVLAIKPSPKRAAVLSQARIANKLIQAACAADKRLTFVNIADPMLGPDGAPREELFKADRLHMNSKGYEIWRNTLRPILLKNESTNTSATASNTPSPAKPASLP